MNVKAQIRIRPKLLHRLGTDRKIGNKVPIHHIDMDEIRTRRCDRAHLLAQSGEVSSQD